MDTSNEVTNALIAVGPSFDEDDLEKELESLNGESRKEAVTKVPIVPEKRSSIVLPDVPETAISKEDNKGKPFIHIKLKKTATKILFFFLENDEDLKLLSQWSG